ncbi:MAG TPA: response regulator [Candidatus Dormibacteraeota bacterium]|nr:response regulator [Candidatus Dormibacteraeota bacterium]
MQSKPRVLLVEDRADLCAMYRLAFDIAGFETKIAVTGAEAVTIAEDGWPEVMVLDLQLPDMDGFAVYDAMRRRGLDTPVIFLSITDDRATISRALSLGAIDYLVKPRIKPADVALRIKHHLERSAV